MPTARQIIEELVEETPLPRSEGPEIPEEPEGPIEMPPELPSPSQLKPGFRQQALKQHKASQS